MTKTHQDMRKGYTYSIFLGDAIHTELEMDSYLRKEFANDFGFEIYAPSGPEAWAGESKPVAEVLTGFSAAKSFLGGALKLASEKGMSNATCAVVFYAFEYDPSLINPNRSHKLEFLGIVNVAKE